MTASSVRGTALGRAGRVRDRGVSGDKNLDRWDPRIRRFVFVSELLSSLAFTVDTGTKTGTLWHGTLSSGPMTTAWSKLVTIVKPAQGILEKEQLDYVIGYADLRGDRAREITAQMAVPYGFWASVVPLYRPRHRRTYELIQLVVRLAKYAEMNFKNAFAVSAAPRAVAASATNDSDANPWIVSEWSRHRGACGSTRAVRAGVERRPSHQRAFNCANC